MKYLCLIGLLVFSNWSLAQTVELEQINALLSQVDAAGPGVIIGVVKDQELLYTVSKGMANLDYNIPISTASNFRLSSTSKQFTAACILHLVDQGRLNLQDSLAKFFPDFSPTLRAITIQQLLNHTSGIRDYMGLMMVQGSRKMDFFNSFIGEDQDIMTLLSRQRDLSFPSGTVHSYSNTNYWLLGQIVGQVAGTSLGAYAQENIFTPLGMNTTSYMNISGQIVPHRAAGYVSQCPDCDRLEYRYQSNSVGDNGVVSNIEDLLLWEREFHQHQLLSASLWKNMLAKGRLDNGKEITYASGLIVETFNGEQVIKHSGQNPGFTSEILRFPDHDLSIIVLGNQNWYDIPRYANEVAQYFFPTQTTKSKPVNKLPPTEASLTTAQLQQFCGDYHFIETNEYRSVALVDSKLVYVRNNGPTSALIPISENALTFVDRPHIRLRFTFGEDGQKQIKWEDPNVGLMHASSYEKVQLTEAESITYVGSYKSDELKTVLEIKSSEEGLQLFIIEHQIPIQATTTDEFVAMGMFSLRFKRDDTGKITGLRLDAPRAGNLLFERE